MSKQSNRNGPHKARPTVLGRLKKTFGIGKREGGASHKTDPDTSTSCENGLPNTTAEATSDALLDTRHHERDQSPPVSLSGAPSPSSPGPLLTGSAQGIGAEQGGLQVLSNSTNARVDSLTVNNVGRDMTINNGIDAVEFERIQAETLEKFQATVKSLPSSGSITTQSKGMVTPALPFPDVEDSMPQPAPVNTYWERSQEIHRQGFYPSELQGGGQGWQQGYYY